MAIRIGHPTIKRESTIRSGDQPHPSPILTTNLSKIRLAVTILLVIFLGGSQSNSCMH